MKNYKLVLIAVLIAYAGGLLTMYIINRMGFKEVTTITIKQEKGDLITNKKTESNIKPSGGTIESTLWSESTGDIVVTIKTPPIKLHSINIGMMPYYDLDNPNGGLFFMVGYEYTKGRFGGGFDISYDPFNKRVGFMLIGAIKWG